MTIQEILNRFDISLFITYVFGILGIYAVYQAYMYNQRNALSVYWYKHISLINLNDIIIPNFKASINGKEIQNLHVLIIFFKNEGTSVLRKSDIVNFLKIEFESIVEVCDVKIFSTNKFNKTFTHFVKGKEVLFDFDFLERKDYVKVQIVYNAYEQIKGKVSGKIIGQNEITFSYGVNSLMNEFEASRKYGSNLMGVMPFIFMIAAALSYVILITIFQLSMANLRFLEKYIDKPRLTGEYFIVLGFVLLPLLLGFLIAAKSHWIVKPFYVTIDKIIEWHQK